MASSQYSASAAPTMRIRVVAHPPLGPLRAWLPLPTATSLHRPPVVADVLAAVSRLLQGRTDIACEIQGFTVLTDSPLSVLDPVNDILDIKVAAAPLPPFPDILAPPVIPPSVASAAQAAAVPLPPSSSSDTDSDGSSDAESCSDMDESSDDDDTAPEVLPSKRPLALLNGHGLAPAPAPGGDERPPKRQRTSSLSPSSSSWSSSASSSSSSSDSSSSSSDSDTDSDSSASHADTPISPRRALAALVPPGEGKRRTRKRNQRKRVLKAARKRERALDAAPSGSAAPVEEDVTVEDDNLVVVEPVRAPLAPAKPDSPPKPAPPLKTLAVAHPPPSTPTPLAPSTTDLAFPQPAPPSRKYSTGGEPGISLVSAGTRNTPSSERGAGGTRAGVSKAQKRGFYREPQPAVVGVAAAEEHALRPERSTVAQQEEPALPAQGSPVYTPTSPAFSPPTPLDDELAPASATASGSARADEQPHPRAPRFVPPSKRTDLPPGLVITSVNVEAAGWEPGLGRVVKGTSRDWIAPARAVHRVEPPVRDVPAAVEDELREQGSGWEGWSGAEEVERGWDKLRPMKKGDGAAKEGARVAVKVLELDPSTFAPTLALKYGRLLGPSSSSSSLRIELHPGCLAPTLEAADEGWYGDEDEVEGDETAYHAKPRIRFGEDLFMAKQEEGKEVVVGDEGVWEGAWDGADVRLVVGL